MGWWGGGVVGSSGALALPGSLVLRLRRLILEAEPPGPYSNAEHWNKI